MGNEWRERFEKDGYIVVEDLFAREEVAAFKEEIHGLIEEDERSNSSKKHYKNGVFMGLAAKSKMFENLACDNRLVDVLRQIIGDNVMFLNDKLVAKAEGIEYPTPWHQDYPYWLGSHKTIVWIALDDATIENGCLRIIPGLRLDMVPHNEGNTDGFGFVNRIRREDLDEDKAISIPAKAGTIIVFSDLTLHSSHPNKSGKDRWAISSIYKDAQKEDPEFKWAPKAMVVTGSQKI